jgi:hypothetical protein
MMGVDVRHGIRAIAQRSAGVLIFLAATLWSVCASGLTQIDFVSDPGDYVGGGQTFSLTPADGSIVATPSGSGVSINFLGTPFVSPKTFWNLIFVPIEGATLTPGNYPSAQRWPFQSPKRPGLSISGDGRGCNSLTGRFTVYEATFDSAGQIFAFAADAEQHCEGAAPALRARVRINSSVPLILSAPQSIPGLPQEVSERVLVTLDGSQSYDPDGQIVAWQWSQLSGPKVSFESPATPITSFRAPRVRKGGAEVRLQLEVQDNAGNRAAGTVDVHVFDRKDRRTLLTFVSPPGDYIGQGATLTFTLADGDATFGRSYGLPYADIYFDGGSFNSWSTIFAAPDGGSLLPGTYLDAERFPFQSAGRPGLSVSGAGRGCNTLSGQFTVTEFDSTTSPPRFGARFEQSCEGFMPPLRGTVLFNAIPPGDAKARVSGPKVATRGTTVTLDGTASASAGSNLVSYRWRQLAGARVITSDTTLPQLRFVMPAEATSALRFELEVMDEDAMVDAAEISVTSE